jgi:hypothetical protein
MAEGLNDSRPRAQASDEHAADRAIAGPAPARARGSAGPASRSLTPHSHKFLAATATLIGVAIGAIAVAVVVALGGSHSGSTIQWSTWHPSDPGPAGEREIADEVSPFYRQSPGAQLVVVTVQNVSGPSTVGTQGSGTQIAVRDPNTGTLAAIQGDTAVYNLCGLGPSCAIAGGTPSAARLLLLRREALELSLYTFKYINSIQNVVAILPPGHTVQTCTGICSQPNPPKKTTAVSLAVVFQRESLQRFLQQPLRDTLPEELPPTVSEMAGAPEAELVSVITGQALFQQQLVQSQTGGNVLVLSPEPPQ